MILRTATAGLAFALLLAGCGGEAEQASVLEAATTQPQATASAQSPSPTPTSEPVVTAHADRPPTKAEMLTVIRRYYEALSRASSTLDTTEAEALSTPNCKPCQKHLESVRAVRAQGAVIDSPPYIVSDAGSSVQAVSGGFGLPVNISYGGGGIRAADGRTVRTFEKRTTLERIAVTRQGDRWLVRSIDLLAS